MHRMATYKRRIIYLSDEEWAGLHERATGRGFTISEYVRRLINGHDLTHSTWDAVKAGRTGEPYPLKDLPGSFNSRPFTPVPKK